MLLDSNVCIWILFIKVTPHTVQSHSNTVLLDCILLHRAGRVAAKDKHPVARAHCHVSRVKPEASLREGCLLDPAVRAVQVLLNIIQGKLCKQPASQSHRQAVQSDLYWACLVCTHVVRMVHEH